MSNAWAEYVWHIASAWVPYEQRGTVRKPTPTQSIRSNLSSPNHFLITLMCSRHISSVQSSTAAVMMKYGPDKLSETRFLVMWAKWRVLVIKVIFRSGSFTGRIKLLRHEIFDSNIYWNCIASSACMIQLPWPNPRTGPRRRVNKPCGLNLCLHFLTAALHLTSRTLLKKLQTKSVLSWVIQFVGECKTISWRNHQGN